MYLHKEELGMEEGKRISVRQTMASSIQFKFICIAPFTRQSLQSSFTGN